MKHNISLVLLSDPQVRLEAQYVPNKSEYERTATNAKVAIVGRSNPKNHYTGGDSKLSLEFEFCANTFYADNALFDTADGASLVKDNVKAKVFDKCRLAESFTFGQDVKVVFGDMYQNEVFIIDSVKISYSDHLSQKFGHLPLKATVSFSLSLNPNKSILPEDLR